MALLAGGHTVSRRNLARDMLAGLAVLIMAIGFDDAPVYAQRGARLDELKAAFVFQFANYIAWPDAAFADDSAPIVIGIVGNEPMVKTLAASVREKKVGARPVKVVGVTDEEDAAGCHILFLDASDNQRVEDYLSAVRAKPVLTVSDDDRFTEEGGIIKLFEAQSKLRFEINVDEADRSGLTISSKLLNLAQVVRDKT